MFTIHEERHMGFKDCPPKQKSWYLHMGDFAQRTGENHLNCVQALYPHFDHIDRSILMDWYSKKSISMSKIQVWFTHAEYWWHAPGHFSRFGPSWTISSGPLVMPSGSALCEWISTPKSAHWRSQPTFSRPWRRIQRTGDAASLRFFVWDALMEPKNSMLFENDLANDFPKRNCRILY